MMTMEKNRNAAVHREDSCYDANFLGIPARAADPTSGVHSLDRRLARALLAAIGNPPVAFVLWNGETITSGDTAFAGRLHFRSRSALYRLACNPELSFGDLYCNEQLEVAGDLSRFLHHVYLGLVGDGDNLFRKFFLGLNALQRRGNSLRGSRRNIHHHYDLGNRFYRLWLDGEHMQYTCAYYADAGMSLEQAQTAKLEHICRKLRLRAGQKVVEAGCGWGGLALYMAARYGVEVDAYNISHEQILWARERAGQLGLADRVRFIEDDYRNIEGNYDVFVSIGMLEHVGVENYAALGTLINHCLDKEHGIGLIHTIGRNRPAQMNAWIEARIFPGGCPPSLGQMMQILEPSPFSVLDVENLRLHYAHTLVHWLGRFERNAGEVTEMYDPVFTRAWRLYLNGSIAAFTSGEMQLFQLLFSRPRNNDVPLTRTYLYQ